ncbi:MAG: hypothetical protein ABGX12_05305, partial [Desulfurobacteriaceae bacterium]
MGILESIKKLLRKVKGRVSIEPVSVNVPKTNYLPSKFINPRYPREYLLELERLVMTNPDLAHAHQI